MNMNGATNNEIIVSYSLSKDRELKLPSSFTIPKKQLQITHKPIIIRILAPNALNMNSALILNLVLFIIETS